MTQLKLKNRPTICIISCLVKHRNLVCYRKFMRRVTSKNKWGQKNSYYSWKVENFFFILVNIFDYLLCFHTMLGMLRENIRPSHYNPIHTRSTNNKSVRTKQSHIQHMASHQYCCFSTEPNNYLKYYVEI